VSSEKLYLNLACFGRTENDIVLCPSVSNNILKIDESLNNVGEIVKYLETLQLFDRPLLDHNAIKHLIFNIQNRYDQKFKRIWTEAQFSTVERFMLMHKPCGLSASVVLIEEVKPKIKEEVRVNIKSIPQREVEPTFDRPSIRYRKNLL
jgi:hypothetical protein